MRGEEAEKQSKEAKVGGKKDMKRRQEEAERWGDRGEEAGE